MLCHPTRLQAAPSSQTNPPAYLKLPQMGKTRRIRCQLVILITHFSVIRLEQRIAEGRCTVFPNAITAGCLGLWRLCAPDLKSLPNHLQEFPKSVDVHLLIDLKLLRYRALLRLCRCLCPFSYQFA